MVIKGAGKGLSCQVKTGDEVSIGRHLDCTIAVPDIRMSKIHCVVRNVDGDFEVLDNNSSNGTFMNGRKIDLCTKIQSGDVIEVGDTEIQFFSEEGTEKVDKAQTTE